MNNDVKFEIMVTYPKTKIAFHIASHSAEVIKYFADFYLTITDEQAKDYKTFLHIMHKENLVICNGQNITATSEASAISIINKIIRQNLEFVDGWISYHGAAVQVEGKTYMFLGSTGAGKTTLATFLSQQPGVCLLSEDVTIINWTTLEVVKQIYPICLRSESYKLLAGFYGCDLNCTEMNYNRKYLYRYPQKLSEKQKYVLEKCFLIDRIETIDEPKCTTMDSIMSYLLNSYCHTDMIRNITSAQYLNKKAILYKLSYNDLNKVYKYLKTI